MKRQQIVLRTPASMRKRQPLLDSRESSSSKYGTRLAEVAGGTTAECAAVCCCGPCAVANFVLLAVYKVPAGLCRKAWRYKRRQRLIKKGLLSPPRCVVCSDPDLVQIHHFSEQLVDDVLMMELEADDKEDVELETEMWDMFYTTGFWRSPSQRSLGCSTLSEPPTKKKL